MDRTKYCTASDSLSCLVLIDRTVGPHLSEPTTTLLGKAAQAGEQIGLFTTGMIDALPPCRTLRRKAENFIHGIDVYCSTYTVEKLYRFSDMIQRTINDAQCIFVIEQSDENDDDIEV
jgi:Na+-transporting methylmalonyl-CoA/oxaloacetate decarboxylase beta subunit